MEECTIYYKKNLSDFTFCEFCLCKKFTANPEKQPSEAIPEDTKANINSEQKENIKINLIRKIQIINSCTSEIISKTEIYISKIQSMCMHSIKNLKVKKHYYIGLLNSVQKYLIPKERQNIQRELKTALVGSIPTQDFKELDDFYGFDFIKEIQNSSNFNSMRINDFKHILEEEYGLPLSATFKSGRYLRGHKGIIRALAITSDNKYIISGGADHTVRIWNLEENSQEAVLYGHTDVISSILVTNDCKYIISASNDMTARIWNFKNKTQEQIISVHIAYHFSLELTSDSNYIAYCTSESTLAVWNFETQLQEIILHNHSHKITAISVSENSRYIICGFIGGSVMIWGLTDKTLEAICQCGSDAVTALALTNDNKYIIYTTYNAVRVWNIENKELTCTINDSINSDKIFKIAGDNKYIYYTTMKNEFKMWNLQEKKQEAMIKYNGYSHVIVLQTNDNTNIASGYYNDKLIVQKMIGSTKDIIMLCKPHFLGTISVTSDSKYIFFTVGNIIEILDIHNINEKYILGSLRSTITSAVVSSDNRFIIFGSGSENHAPFLIDNTVRVWDLHEKIEIAVLQGHKNNVTALAISRDNKYIVSGSSDKTVILWNLHEKKKIAILLGHSKAITAVAITSENRYIVSASDDCTLRIWSVDKGINLAVLEGALFASKILITFDNKYIVSDSHNSLRIWNLKKRKSKIVLEGHTCGIMSLAATIDNKYIISGSLDMTVRVWRIRTRTKTFF